jgi:hypothetical protein
MKHLKRFNENIHSREPKVGDYVILSFRHSDINTKTFFNREIGQIVDINNLKTYFLPYTIRYENVTPENSYVTYAFREQIVKFSDKKGDLEVMINADKYNI